MQETRVRSLRQEDPLEKEMVNQWNTTLVFLPGESHGRRSLVGYSPRGRRESDTTEQLHLHLHLLVDRGWQLWAVLAAAMRVTRGLGARKCSD